MEIKDIKFPKADNKSDWNTSFESTPDGVSAVSTLNKNFEKKLQKFIDKNYISKEKIKNKIKELEKEFDFYAGREHAEWQDGEFDGEMCDDISLKIGTLKELLREE